MEWAAGRKTGVVDEDLNLQAEVRDSLGQTTSRVLLRQVARERLGAHAVLLAEFSGYLLKAIRAARDEHQPVTTARQFAGDRGADAC
jgi:hypothetical protein